MKVQCEKCEEIIAITLPGRLRLPINSTMFNPRTPEDFHPWPAFEQWVDMRCPFCTNNPFTITEEMAQEWVEHRGPGPIQVKTTRGFYKVGSLLEPGQTPKPKHTVAVPTQEQLDAEWNDRQVALHAKAPEQETTEQHDNPNAATDAAPLQREKPGRPRKVKKDAKT